MRPNKALQRTLQSGAAELNRWVNNRMVVNGQVK
jgi:hypothetical protein